MPRFMRDILSCQLLACLVACSAIPNHPSVESRLTPGLVTRTHLATSPYPYGTPALNEFSWLGWDPNDTGTQRADAAKIHDAYSDMINMIFFALVEIDLKSATFKRWFDEEDAPDVKEVLERILVSTGQMNSWVGEREDKWGKCDSLMDTYSVAEKEIFHFCPAGLARPNARDLKCSDLDTSASQKMKSVAFTMLHQIMHRTEIGDAAMKTHIRDHKTDAYGSFTLPGPDKLTNAQNYAFLAAEAYHQARSNCVFIDPLPSTDNTPLPNDEVTGSLADNKAINIIYRTDTHDAFTPLNAWYLYETSVGTSAICAEDDKAFAKFDTASGQRDPKWPNGVFAIKPFGVDCEYKNNNENAGALWCKEREGPIQCRKENDMERKGCRDRIYHKAYVYCQ